MNNEFHQIMLTGETAWNKVKTTGTDWIYGVRPALHVARKEAMARSGAKKPEGRGYNEAFSAILAEYRMDDIDKDTRAALFNIDDKVVKWWEQQPNKDRLNHPRTILDKFIGNMDPSEREILRQAFILRKEKRAAKRLRACQNILKTTTAPTPLTNIKKRYPVILADPPWNYAAGFSDRSVLNHYQVMPTEEICQLPIGDLTTDDAILFLWTTNTHLFPDAFKVMEAWGFEYKNHMVWVKDTNGQAMGYYVRNIHELLLICKKGDMVYPKLEGTPLSAFTAPRTAHSAKPDVVYDIIDKMYPEFPKLELFARNMRSGWDSWGNSVELLRAA
jgi:N6-adenosine-specific RNA methylase IME4